MSSEGSSDSGIGTHVMQLQRVQTLRPRRLQRLQHRRLHASVPLSPRRSLLLTLLLLAVEQAVAVPLARAWQLPLLVRHARGCQLCRGGHVWARLEYQLRHRHRDGGTRGVGRRSAQSGLRARHTIARSGAARKVRDGRAHHVRQLTQLELARGGEHEGLGDCERLVGRHVGRRQRQLQGASLRRGRV